jgi:hypothetical protein
MIGSGAYTNGIRVFKDASMTKTQYPGRIAGNNYLLPASGLFANYQMLEYFSVTVGDSKYRIVYVLDGGFYNTLPLITVDGGDSKTELNTIFDGGN